MRKRRNLPMIMPRCASAAKRRNGHGNWKEKRKFRKVEGEFSAHGARAVFLPPALEYKKKAFYFLEDDTDQFISGGDHVFVMRSAAQKTGHPELFLLGVTCLCDAVYDRVSRKMGDGIEKSISFPDPGQPV